MWTPAELASERRPYRGRAYRIVEAQHVKSTNRLVDRIEDQSLLEELVDEVKPRLPEAARHLDWLLASPFRYGYGRPSRFRPADERRGIFYAAADIETAVAETAYWRLRFLAASDGTPPPTQVVMSLFSVKVETEASLHLDRPPFEASEQRWVHPTDYGPTQALAQAARKAGVELLRTRSAWRAQGYCTVILAPEVLRGRPRPEMTLDYSFSDGRIDVTSMLPRFSARYRLDGTALTIDI